MNTPFDGNSGRNGRVVLQSLRDVVGHRLFRHFIVNGQLTVTNPLTGTQQFYRLSQ
jgi:hypothetical protein